MAKKATGINKPQTLSDDLAEFMGKDEATRGEVTSAIWAYIKENDLQDPNDKRNICPDATLKPLIGSKKISMFKMTAALSKHFLS